MQSQMGVAPRAKLWILAEILVADEPIEVALIGNSSSVRAIEIGLSRSDSADGVAAADVARLCSAWGTAVITREPFDMSDCDTAALCPAGLVVGGGDVNGVNVDAAADEPA